MSYGENPKDRIGITKPRMFSVIPPIARLELGAAMANGAEKYGAFNWRENSVVASIYLDALDRHLSAWMDGEEIAADSGVHHLGHAMACLAILLDAQAGGNLYDDRPPPGAFSRALAARTKKPAEAGSSDGAGG